MSMPPSSNADVNDEQPSIAAWLAETHRANALPSYRHSRFVEDQTQWEAVRESVESYFRDAHFDAIQRLRRVVGVSLHPAGSLGPLPRPYDQYPFGLPDITVQGYFGEILAGLLAERIGASGIADWEVPAHLFHTHVLVFQQLEQQAQSGVPVTTIVGRTGDDCLAFRRGNDKQIVSVLYCEAKCTRTHDASLIADAHEKVSSSGILDIHQLVEALESRNCPVADEWASGLRVFHAQIYATPATPVDRHDAVFYVHGQVPVREATWISPNEPHAKYVAGRPLHTVEVCLADVANRVRSIYRAETW